MKDDNITLKILKYITPILIIFPAILLIQFSNSINSETMSINHLTYVIFFIVLFFDIYCIILKIKNKNYRKCYLLILATYTFYFFIYSMYQCSIESISKTISYFISVISIAIFITIFAQILLEYLSNSSIYLSNILLIILSLLNFYKSDFLMKVMIVLFIISLLYESFYIKIDNMKEKVVYKEIK